MRAWVKDNNMEDFSTMLTYTADKFTPTGNYKEKDDPETLMKMPPTPLQELTYENVLSKVRQLHFLCDQSFLIFSPFSWNIMIRSSYFQFQ